MDSLHTIMKAEDIFFNKLEEKLRTYFIISGLPEAVYSWRNEKNIEEVNKIQDNILAAYENDFARAYF